MYVLFLDLLGFASMVTQLSDDEEASFLEALRLSSATDSEPTTLNVHLVLSGARVRTLYEDYMKFQASAHRAVDKLIHARANDTRTLLQVGERLISRLGNEPDGTVQKIDQPALPVRSVLFSDSLFLAFPNPVALLEVGSELLLGLLMKGVPARAGFAEGNFAAFEWSVRASEGWFHAHTPFLGSGVVRAYYAESTGPKGIRLLVHPSASHLVPEMAGHVFVGLPAHERGEHASHELNLLWWPWWQGAYPSRGENLKEVDEWLRPLWEAAPQRAKVHYESTAEALSRMQAAFGEVQVRGNPLA